MDKHEIIIRDPSEEIWAPKIGREFDRFMGARQTLSAPEREALTNSTIGILSKCLPCSDTANKRTGLVMGLVQSGKTMSFTAVCALARDNGYRLVIVITGTTDPLSKQSNDRLFKDLQVDDEPGLRWAFYMNPKQNQYRKGIEDALGSWADFHKPENFRQTVVITVMKNWRHIGNLAELLSEMNLSRFSTLIIDDEADQASLNTRVRAGEESTTYSSILRLRALFCSCTYIQYTATPQANLLISKIDSLSPDFGYVLEPGSKYTGGEEFFSPNSGLIVEIDDVELPENWIELHPPPSLELAFQMYAVLVANQILSDAPERRSMMVHPSHTRNSHDTYMRWIEGLRTSWQTLLEKNGDDRKSLIQEFQNAYLELSKTCQLKPFEELSAKLSLALNKTVALKMNSSGGKTQQPDWHNSLFHILVGGEAMARGFTVEGLTITYMPRGVGVGNADTIQQRARFFGYKKNYINECRVFLEGNVLDSFISYVDHEQDLRSQLTDHVNSGKSLKDWKRQLFLDSILNPTRSSVISDQIFRINSGGSWLTQKYPISGGDDVVSDNALLVESLIDGIKEWEEFEGHPRRTPEQKHLCAEVLLSELFEAFLVDYSMGGFNDSIEYSALLFQLGRYLMKKPNSRALLVRMSPNTPPRKRKLDKGERVILFQSSNSDKKTGELIYPGDTKIRENDLVTVQIHSLKIEDDSKQVVYSQCPAIAVWVPGEAGKDTLVQDE